VYRYSLKIIVSLILFLLTIQVHAQTDDFYCYDSYDEYRQIKYWAKRHISVSDYSYKSGDSNYLNLTYRDNKKKKFGEETSKELIEHFNKEFDRLIKNSLPYHDTDAGRNKRFKELYKKYGEQDNFLDILQAQEEARRNSLYGTNPGAIFCLIKIERREFPVLYEMNCSIVANKELWNRGGLEENKIGFSTPEHILGELKHSITQELAKLRSTMRRINSCIK